MKKFIFLLFISSLLPEVLSAQEKLETGQLNDKMILFRDACLTERKALAEKNQLTMGKALNLFNSLRTAGFKYSLVSQSQDDALGKAIVQYSSEFCKFMMTNDFSMIKLSDLSAMRDIQAHPDLLTDYFSLKPDSSVIISIPFGGDCAMMVVSETGLPLSVTSSIDGKPLAFHSEEQGTVNWQTWTLPKFPRTVMEFRIENPSDKEVSFTIAVQ